MLLNMYALLTILFLLLPAGILWLCHHQDWARKVGIIVLCYVAGLLLGNVGLLPARALPVQQTVADISVVMAMPLLLFTLDLRQWRHVAGKALLSMFFATTAVVAIATCIFLAFKGQGETAASHFAAMSVGVYTGGTPNLAAIKTGLEIPNSEYVIFHSLDTVIGAVYLLSMLTIGVPLFRRFLARPALNGDFSREQEHHFGSDDFSGFLRAENVREILKTLALTIFVVAAALGVAELFSSANRSVTVIVTLTTAGILLSLIPQVRQLHLSYKIGMYLIYVFCFAAASMASVDQLVEVDPVIVIFLAGTVLSSLLLHCLLCKLAGIDSDTFMVTSVAAVCSAPFVPMMARALGNPSMILSGMTTGIIGYALGNYLGISLGLLLQGL